MLTYKHTKHKHTVTAEDHETTKQAILVRSGWVLVPEVKTPNTIATASSSFAFATDESADTYTENSLPFTHDESSTSTFVDNVSTSKRKPKQ